MRKLPLLYRLLVVFLPAEFRREYGEELTSVLSRKERDAAAAGGGARMRTRARESLALARLCVRTRLDSRTRRPGFCTRAGRLFDDLGFALRSYRKNFVLPAVVVLTLAVSIGGNAAMFGLTDQLLWRELPVRDPERLVLLSAPGPWFGWRRGTDTFSYPAYLELRDENRVFDGLLARYRTSLTLEQAGGAERVEGVLVSGNYFQVLGVGAELGRVLGPEDDLTVNGHPVAVLSHRYWSDRFGADPSIVGGTVRLNGHPVVVLGVARRGFQGVEVGRAADLFVPLSMKPLMTPTWDHLDNRRSNFLHLFARLREGISSQEAEASANVLYRGVLERDLEAMPDPSERFAKEYRAKPLSLKPGSRGISELRERYQAALLLLQGMLGLLLWIVCANLASLLVARSAGRRKEMAVHLALGASRLALARRVLVESLVLALSGGLLGVLFSSWTASVLVSALPIEGAATAFTTGPDLRILGFALLLSVATGLAFGLVSARESSRTSLASTLKDESAAAGGGRPRLGRALVTAQVALALLLLMGAGLFGRSLHNLRRVEVGFQADDLMSFSIDPSLNGYSQERIQGLLRELSRELGRLPGVLSVSVAEVPTFTDDRWTQTIRVQGYEHAEGEDMNVGVNGVGPGYFENLGIPLLRGRDFAETDRDGLSKVAIINETMARYFFGEEDPVGRRFRFGAGDEFDIEIVGVVPETKYRSLREPDLRFAFIPYMQSSRLSDVTFYLRTAGTSMEELRAAVGAIDPALPIFGVSLLAERVEDSLFLDRAVAGLAAAFGAIACFLAAIGLYGVMSCTVARRTREIGLRMALGASRRDVLGMILREVAVLAGLGLLVGMAAGLSIGRLLSSQLFELSPWDPLTLAAATILVAAAAILSGYLPARSASRMDPVLALKRD